MHVNTTTSYFDRCRVGIDELLDTHTNMRAIEGTIDEYALDDEERTRCGFGRAGAAIGTAVSPLSSPPRAGRMDMIDPAGRYQGPPPRVGPLRGKNLGPCAACGRPVFGEQDFSRVRGRVMHVRCPISAHRSSSMPVVIETALARQMTSRDR